VSRPATGRRIDIRRGLIYEGASFTPKSLPGLLLWLRADLGITLAGSKVSAWADQSGNGYDFAQGTDARRPVFNAGSATFSGQPCAQYAAGQILSSLAALPACPAGVTFVMAIGNTPSQNTVLMEIGSGGTDAGGIYIDGPIRYRGLYNKGGFTQHAFTGPPASSSLCVSIDPSVAAANQVRSYVDDVVGASIGALAGIGTLVSAVWDLGARAPLIVPCTADIAEVIVVNRVLTAAERAQVTAYQVGRFG